MYDNYRSIFEAQKAIIGNTLVEICDNYATKYDTHPFPPFTFDGATIGSKTAVNTLIKDHSNVGTGDEDADKMVAALVAFLS